MSMFVFKALLCDDAFILNKDGKYTVGRVNGDCTIKHSSVSRKHAEIIIKNNAAYLLDCNSKYLTRINGKILLAEQEMIIQDGCEITFGEVKYKFEVKKKIVTCSTGLKDDERNLVPIIQELGGEYMKDWDDRCTHLTTNEVIITLKVLHAIIDNKDLVTPEYWKVYLKNVKKNKLPPKSLDYYPPSGENVINSKHLEYNPSRKVLFKDKLFIFWNKKKQLRMQAIIEKTGGKCKLLEKSNQFDCELLTMLNESIVIDPEDENIEKLFSNVLNEYKSKGKRLIPVQEIVLAILQCSCAENCNPNFDRAKAIFSKETQKAGSSKSVIPDTESEHLNVENSQNYNVIPETNVIDSNDIPPVNIRSVIRDSQLASVTSESEIVNSKKLKSAPKLLLNPAKKIKLDPIMENVPEKDPVKKIKLDPIMKNEPVKDIRSFFKRPNDDLSGNNVQKRLKPNPTSSNTNPFDTNISENPFLAIIKQEVRSSSPDNPFKLSNLRIQEQIKNENVDTNDAIDERPSTTRQRPQASNYSIFSKKKIKPVGCIESSPIDFSSLKHEISDGTWLDKNVKNETVSVKPELDEEERMWCEKFNNSVVIVKKSLVQKVDNSIFSSSNSSCGDVKNFKKFRKVPVPKSGVVLKCTKKVFGRTNLGVDYGHSEDEDNRDI